ncbi:MAG: translation elongation factor 4, partial [Clostridia bacterium]|nr:translation elongation factor 4 [Clostridia bacterium]
MASRQEKIRNFCIIAHIDHGKSTLADRLIEATGSVAKRDMQNQILDSMDLERERGITIKLTPTKMQYHLDGEDYILNLIDTPGHVDFTYEVSRSLCACEGAILVVDASQGVEAQTLANAYLAIENNLEILPVINKIDLPSARVDEVKKEIEDVIGLPADDIPCISAKEGINIDDVLRAVVKNIPAPRGEEDKPLKALIFDSFYDNFSGAISLIRVVDGSVKAGDKIKMMATGKTFDVTEVGVFTPRQAQVDVLRAGDVGYLAGSIKNVADTKVGDTITFAENGADAPLAGYKEVLPVVFCGIFCVDGSKYEDLKEALEKLSLSDASLVYEPEVSQALGFGFRCGFLGLLHMEIITERLEREYNLDLITTAPSVNYKVYKTDGEILEVSNPSNLPPAQEIDFMEEPIVRASIMLPKEFVGNIMDLCQDRRGTYINMQYLDDNRVTLINELPLNEIIYDFFDALKSRTKGYASFDYE